MFAYCENNSTIYTDKIGYAREKMTYSWDVPKVSSTKKVYVLYYSYGKRNFKKQAGNCYNYSASSKNTTIKGFRTKDDFINIWNKMPNGLDYVFIFVHGGRGVLYFYPKNKSDSGSLTNFNSLKDKKIKCKIWLFSCEGAAGGKNSVAAKLANREKNSYVYALTSSLSFSWTATGYAARPKRGRYGYWQYFIYNYNSRGKLVYTNKSLYR